MAIKSSIFQKKDDKLTTLDSGKNPKTLAEKSEFEKYLRSDDMYKPAYDEYYKQHKLSQNRTDPLTFEQWKKDQGISNNFVNNGDAIIKYTELYYPQYLSDVTEYYAGLNATPANSASTKNPATWAANQPKTSATSWYDKIIQDVVSPNVGADTNTKPETETKPETSTGTTTGTTDKTTGENEDGSYYFKTYDELMEYINGLRGQAGEGHDIYKGNMANANAYVEDYAQFLQDIRDVIMGEAQANPLESEWGKGILDYYGVLGENSANAVNAATAGENAGNIDSFAAANAERQRLSRYGQGVQTIMGMSTERFNNMINGLNAIGVNTDILFGGQQGITDTSANYAASLYGTDADSTAAYNQLLADIESGSNPYVQLNDDMVMDALKEAYAIETGEDIDKIDWTKTDDEIWAEAFKDLQGDTNGYISKLSPVTLKRLRNLIKGVQTA